MIKNTAYAWRQALFFLSLVDHGQQRAAVSHLRQRCAAAPTNWQRRFEPVLLGLEALLEGRRFDSTGRVSNGGRFLGWSVGPHWLLADTPDQDASRRNLTPP